MSGKSVCILLAAGAAAIVAPWSVAQETRTARSRPAPVGRRRISINLSGPAGATGRPAVPVLAGGTITVNLVGEPALKCLWQFGYRDTVIKQGRLQLDNEGAGRFKLVLPDVRSRAECTLMVITGQKKFSDRLIIFPSARLAGSAKLIKAARFAVIDDGGGIQKAFKAEKVSFENLSSQLLQDSFDGGAVILAGFKKKVLLESAFRRFDGRIEKGMFAVIVNPPEKWVCRGISRRRPSVPIKASVTFAKDFGRAIEATDLGNGPWQSVLHTEDQWEIPEWVADFGSRSLWFVIHRGRSWPAPAWVTDVGVGLQRFVLYCRRRWRVPAWIEEVSKDDAGKTHRVKHPLIAVRRIGRGGVIVVMLPQMSDPVTDAVGRAVLDELVLRVLKERSGSHSGKE